MQPACAALTRDYRLDHWIVARHVIHITDNAIIPLKERVVDEFYDPLLMLVRKIRNAKKV